LGTRLHADIIYPVDDSERRMDEFTQPRGLELGDIVNPWEQ